MRWNLECEPVWKEKAVPAGLLGFARKIDVGVEFNCVSDVQSLLAGVREIDGLKNLNRRPERSRVPRRFHVQNQRSGKNMQRAVRVPCGSPYGERASFRLEMLNGTNTPEIFESRKRPPPEYFPLDHSSGGVFGNQSEHDWL
jgi:hypothetical protein